MQNKKEIIKKLLTNHRVTEIVAKWNLTPEQIDEALPILIDMAYETDDDQTDFLTSLKMHNGQPQRIRVRSTYQQKFAYRDNIVTRKIEDIEFDDFKDFIQEPGGRREIVKFVSALINKTAPNKKGCYIYGDMGIGKTFLLKRMAKKFAQQNYKVGYVTTSNLYQKVIDAISNNGSKDTIVNSLKNVDYLFVDDIGAEPISSWFRDDVLFNILNYRMNAELTTFFTSNYSIKKLSEIESRTFKSEFRDWDKVKRLINRIEALSVPFHLSGSNKRD